MSPPQLCIIGRREGGRGERSCHIKHSNQNCNLEPVMIEKMHNLPEGSCKFGIWGISDFWVGKSEVNRWRNYHKQLHKANAWKALLPDFVAQILRIQRKILRYFLSCKSKILKLWLRKPFQVGEFKTQNIRRNPRNLNEASIVFEKGGKFLRVFFLSCS